MTAHWSLQQLRPPPPPGLRDEVWAGGEVGDKDVERNCLFLDTLYTSKRNLLLRQRIINMSGDCINKGWESEESVMKSLIATDIVKIWFKSLKKMNILNIYVY